MLNNVLALSFTGGVASIHNDGVVNIFTSDLTSQDVHSQVGQHFHK